MSEMQEISDILMKLDLCQTLEDVMVFLRSHGATSIQTEGANIMAIDGYDVTILGGIHHVRIMCTRLPLSADTELMVRQFMIVEKIRTPNGYITKETTYHK